MDDLLPPLQAPCAPRLAALDADAPSDFKPLRLVLQPGGLCVELNKNDMLIGRHSEADVRLSLPDISRRHCRFVFAEGNWRIFDLNSLNGIYVNGERLQEATVLQGDRLRIGSLTFEVDLRLDEENGPKQRRVTHLLTDADQSIRKAS